MCVLQAPCSQLPAVSGMTIAYSNGLRAGSIATYICTAIGYVPSSDGSTISDPYTRTCLADGSSASHFGGVAPTTCLVRR
eukprot:COSAG02_NODE_3182_length_7215_cov_20.148539_4_plen_80_part_00